MKRKRIEEYINITKWLGILAAVAVSGIVWLLTRNIMVTGMTASGLLFLCVLQHIQYYLEELYISDVVSDLSKLVDVLMQLKEQEIFPENEDSLVSKLQSKVIKLVKILKSKEEKALLEQENIKSLVSDLSHQLKTPIANLKMYSHFLEENSLEEDKRREYVEIICLCVERLNFLSESMIKISRLESGLIHMDIRENSINKTVLKAVKNVYVSARKKHVEIRYEEENQIRSRHDANWTSEAVFNLLDNAVKYAKENAIIYLRIKSLGMFVQIEVEDENGEIAEQERSKIFSRFYRGANSRNKEGVGVGLYLAREISLKQGGYMSLKTTKKGNVFSIVLPISNS